MISDFCCISQSYLHSSISNFHFVSKSNIVPRDNINLISLQTSRWLSVQVKQWKLDLLVIRRVALFEFFLNFFTEFSFSLNSVTKIFVIKRAQTCYLLCKRLGCYHSTANTHVRDRIFIVSSIHASEIYQIP